MNAAEKWTLRIGAPDLDVWAVAFRALKLNSPLIPIFAEKNKGLP